MQTDIILSGRNAVFLHLVHSSLQSPNASLNSVMSGLYKKQQNLLHLESVANVMTPRRFTSDEGAAWQSQYIIRIPAQRQAESEKSIESGSDVLSTAMRYIYYGSTDLLN